MHTFTNVAERQFTTDDGRTITGTVTMVNDDPDRVTVEIREGISGARFYWPEITDVAEWNTPLSIEEGFIIPGDVMADVRSWLSYLGFGQRSE
jgi:hypothetical protein